VTWTDASDGTLTRSAACAASGSSTSHLLPLHRATVDRRAAAPGLRAKPSLGWIAEGDRSRNRRGGLGSAKAAVSDDPSDEIRIEPRLSARREACRTESPRRSRTASRFSGPSPSALRRAREWCLARRTAGELRVRKLRLTNRSSSTAQRHHRARNRRGEGAAASRLR